MFSFSNFDLKKGNKIIIPSLNWVVEQGQHWAIVGPTGSGKTSLLEAVLLAVKKDKSLKDSIVRVPNDFSNHYIVKAAMQYYQQRFNAFDATLAPTVRAFLTEQIKPIGTVDELSVRLKISNISDEELTRTTQLLRISHLLDRHLTSLSNGETRRSLLCYSLLKNPKILLLDNPFVGLDVDSRIQLHDILNGIMQSGVTVIMATSPREIPANITHVLDLGKDQNDKAEDDSLVDQSILQSFINQRFGDFEYAINLRKAKISYGKIKILDGLDWQVKRGEKWAVLGPNGSGKSTLLSLITADNPQSYANDYDLFDRKRGSGESIWDIKKRIGFLSPELQNYFPRHYSCFEVIASGLFDRLGIKFSISDWHTVQTDRVISLLKLEKLSNKMFGSISTGEQRLVLLARALVKNPPLLILDEPCQGIDRDQMERFKNIVQQLCQDTDRTLLYVTHYADEIPDCVTKTLQL